MQIIIPMSGFGERFRQAGYDVPKPLIEIDGKPIIAHVIDMFPGEKDFLFICNQDHLKNPNYRMQEILKAYCPAGRIIGIPPHKLGPVYAVRQVEALIDLSQPVLVNYCDFTCYWNWHHFKKFVESTGCQGAIPAYKGFHPHTLGHTHYAYMREANHWLLDIQEKQPYTDNRMEEYASTGAYYFASGQLMSDAFRECMEQELLVNNEYYVSLAYKTMLAKKLPISVYPIQHFMQWGTPSDAIEYQRWSNAFRQLIALRPPSSSFKGTLIIPMAGLGKRFSDEGYTTTKPLIHVSGKPMVLQATHDLPPANHQVFILRDDIPEFQTTVVEINRHFPSAIIKTVPNVTEGQACTALLGLQALQEKQQNIEGPITFGACDNGALYDTRGLNALFENPDVDIIVWGVRSHANAIRHPHMFGWIDADDHGRIAKISVKKPLGTPTTDPIVLGTFTFRRCEDFQRIVNSLLNREGRINGEFYLDSCINDAIELGLRCHLFEVESFLSWGTPNDLKTFEYWQSCFHKWPNHPYRLDLDARIPTKSLSTLKTRYQKIVPALSDNKGMIKTKEVK